MQSVPRNIPEVVVCFGPPGTGKSLFCQTLDPGAYWKPRGEWWCGYEQQETVVLDDYYAWLPYDTMLRLCDRYPLLLGTKGGQTSCHAKRVIFTTNTLPHKWYNEARTAVTWPAMERRFTKIKWMKTIEECVDYEGLNCYRNFLLDYYIENPELGVL